MIYSNQNGLEEDGREREQPSVSVCSEDNISLTELDRQRREDEIERYKQNPDVPMPIVFKGPFKIRWPKKFR